MTKAEIEKAEMRTLLVQGSAEAPVNLFPSQMLQSQTTKITMDGGQAEFSYVRFTNPQVQDVRWWQGLGVTLIDHALFVWDAHDSVIRAGRISNSVLHQFRGGGAFEIMQADNCLFDTGWLAPQMPSLYAEIPDFQQIHRSVFLQDNENITP